MAKGVMIKDAPLVEVLDGSEKIPVSDGSNEPRAVSIEQIKGFIGLEDAIAKAITNVLNTEV